MQRKELLTRLIKKGESRIASRLLDKIYEENECRSYAAALEKILLIETAKQLNTEIADFYLDSEKLALQLFSQNPPTGKSVIDHMCALLADFAQKNRMHAYEKAMGYIRQNMCDNQLTITAAAEYAGVSQSALVKLFEQNVRMTPGAFLGKLRVEKSLKLLENGGCVQSVAESVGFSSCETYIRTFKRQMGITPGQWKRNKLFL